MIQVQSHEGITGLQYCQQYGSVGLGARVGLHVGILCTEKLTYAVDSQLLYLVNNLATTIVTVSRIALGILVSQVRSHGFHHLVAYEVLTCNQLNAFQLALMLFLNQLKDFVVSVHCLCLLGLY